MSGVCRVQTELMIEADIPRVIELLAAIRWEKNAVLDSDKGKASEHAELARKKLAEAGKLRDELGKIAATDVISALGKGPLDLDRALDEFEKNQKEVLRLAVMKTNGEAKDILHKELHPWAHDLEEVVASIAEGDGGMADAGAIARSAAKVSAGQQVISRLYDLMYHLSLHIDADN